jgi:predicted nucleic acid-binding Zn ribbon protein
MRVSASILVVLAAFALAGAASARDPKDPQQRHTAADTRSAHSIAIKRTDLATGWKAAPQDKPGPPCSAEPDESKLVQTARIDPTFVWKDGVTSIGTEVDIFRTAAQAREDWRLSTLKVVSSCLLESARKQVGKSATVRVIAATRLAAPTHGERSFHYQVIFEVHGKHVVPFVTDLVAIGIGRISVVLHSFTVGAPPPASELSPLTALLAKRLVAASGGI